MARPMRILVVDDSRDAAVAFREWLLLRGCKVKVSFSGDGAVRMAPGWAPDVALLDIDLPDLDGWVVAERLREDLPDRPLIAAVTGHGCREDVAQSQATGLDYHFVKPVNLDAVFEILQAYARDHGL